MFLAMFLQLDYPAHPFSTCRTEVRISLRVINGIA